MLAKSVLAKSGLATHEAGPGQELISPVCAGGRVLISIVPL